MRVATVTLSLQCFWLNEFVDMGVSQNALDIGAERMQGNYSTDAP